MVKFICEDGNICREFNFYLMLIKGQKTIKSALIYVQFLFLVPMLYFGFN